MVIIYKGDDEGRSSIRYYGGNMLHWYDLEQEVDVRSFTTRGEFMAGTMNCIVREMKRWRRDVMSGEED